MQNLTDQNQASEILAAVDLVNGKDNILDLVFRKEQQGMSTPPMLNLAQAIRQHGLVRLIERVAGNGTDLSSASHVLVPFTLSYRCLIMRFEGMTLALRKSLGIGGAAVYGPAIVGGACCNANFCAAMNFIRASISAD